MEIDDLTRTIIGCAFKVHNTLGQGFLERVYENALRIEVEKLGIQVKQQDEISVWYEGHVVGNFCPDLWIPDQLIIEIKAVNFPFKRENDLNRTSKEQRDPGTGEKQIERVRRVCMALPETVEKLSHGEPTFFVRKKVFAMFSNNHHSDGHVAVMIPTAIGIQAMLIESSPQKFYRPAYVGVRGWVGIELDRVTDEELKLHLHEAWRLIAPQKLLDAFDESQL